MPCVHLALKAGGEPNSPTCPPKGGAWLCLIVQRVAQGLERAYLEGLTLETNFYQVHGPDFRLRLDKIIS